MTQSTTQLNVKAPHDGKYLTIECKCVQGELLDLAAALEFAPLAEYAALTPTFLAAVREFRQHLREHAVQVEGQGGLYAYLADGAATLANDLATLSGEHAQLGAYLATLEAQLAGFDPKDESAAEAIRQYARRLSQLTTCHQQHGCRLAARAGNDANRGRRS